MVKKNSRTYLLAPVMFTPNAWFPSLKVACESWKFAVIHWPWHASLRYLAELNSPPPSDIRPDASRLRTVHSSCVDSVTVLKTSPGTTDPATKTSCTRGLTHDFPLLLKVDSSFRQPISKEDFVRLASDAEGRPCSPKFSSPFLLFTWRPWRNDRVKYLH